MRDVLITSQEVLYHAPTKHQIDIRTIEQSIIIAEERFIRHELGTLLYDDLATKKNLIITSGNIVAQQALIGETPELKEGDVVNAYEYLTTPYKDLWTKYLWKLLAECVVTTALPEGFVQMSSEGAFHSVPPAGLMVSSGLVTPLLGSMKWAMDKKTQDRIAPLMQSMHNYLCKNKADFPLYDTINCPDTDCDGTLVAKTNKWAGICVNIYDETDKANNNY